jgi:hypothetical protein
MVIGIFSDMVNAVKVIAKFAAIPEGEREHYREVMGDTYELLHSATSLVQNRLSRLLQIDDQGVFIRELRGLDNLDEWKDMERNVHFCHKLDAARYEMQTLMGRLKGLSVPNWDDLNRHVDRVFVREGTLAEFINYSLLHLARMSDDAARSSTGYEMARKAVLETRDAVDKERNSLISSEREFRDEVWQ